MGDGASPKEVCIITEVDGTDHEFLHAESVGVSGGPYPMVMVKNGDGDVIALFNIQVVRSVRFPHRDIPKSNIMVAEVVPDRVILN